MKLFCLKGRGDSMERLVKTFDELTPAELYEILRLRVSVFVVEQNCSYQELDGKDKEAYHVFFRDEAGIQGYARVLPQGVSFPEASIGRVIAVKRRCGIGSRIVLESMEVAKEKWNASSIRIEAQTYAKKFYETLGFRQVSEEFLEDGIPHIEMLLDETSATQCKNDECTI